MQETLEAMRSALAEAIEQDSIAAPSPPTADAPGNAWEDRVLLEDELRFSESMIWTLQRRYFEEAGEKAWSGGIVPNYVTSNAFIARAYAAIIMGYLRDLAPRTDQPLTIVELGAGSGQFSFHLLQWLQWMLESSGLNGRARYRYIITDFTEANIRFCREHPGLRRLNGDREIDFALFDVTAPAPLQLELAGETLRDHGPTVVIANYLFDSIPQDLFAVRDDALFECRLRLWTKGTSAEADAAAQLRDLEPEFVTVPLEGEYYDEADLNAVLEQYRREMPPSVFLFPHLGMRMLNWFRERAGGQVLLLSGDKGAVHREDLEGKGFPQLVRHGSFSLSVNYHALAAYVRRTGGALLHSGRYSDSINVCAFLLDGQSAEYPETGQACTGAVTQYGPDDFFRLKAGVERNFDRFTATELMAYIRMAGYDPKALLRCIPHMRGQLDSLKWQDRENLLELVSKVTENYYEMATKTDWWMTVGEFLEALGEYGSAELCYERSIVVYGEGPLRRFRIAACRAKTDEGEAVEMLEALLAEWPEYGAAAELLANLDTRGTAPS